MTFGASWSRSNTIARAKPATVSGSPASSGKPAEATAAGTVEASSFCEACWA
jgi:hypothetical protein